MILYTDFVSFFFSKIDKHASKAIAERVNEG